MREGGDPSPRRGDRGRRRRAAGLAVAAAVLLAGGAGAASAATGAPTVTTIHVGYEPDRVAVGADAVWAGDDGNLVRVDLHTHQVRTIPDATTPVAASGDTVWARADLEFDTLERLDHATGAVTARVPLPGSPSEIAIGPTAVWVVDSTGDLTRIDPASAQVVATVPLGEIGFGVTATPDAVWVTGQDVARQPLLWRVDPASDRLVATISTGAPCGLLASAAGDTWAECGTLQHVDPTTGQLAATDVNALNGLAVSPSAVYALDADGHLTALDPTSGHATPVLTVPPLSEGVALGGGALWIANPALNDATATHGAGTVLRVEPIPTP